MAARDSDQRPNIIVVLTDDQGYADLGAQGVLSDVQTPHIDQLAEDGTRMTSGYVTAPQCTPSRAGLITGKYQQRFGLDDNRFNPMPLQETTLADRLKNAGYTTGMVGKWHLEIDKNSQDYEIANTPIEQRVPFFPDQRGFDDVYFGYVKTWWTNFDIQGNTLPAQHRKNTNYRLDIVTDASIAFINRQKQKPFFLYTSYYGPHVPLSATDRYLSRFSSVTETRRQHALAMIAAIDDGVGRIRETLDSNGLSDNTLIFFISDNGAPLGIHKLDLPVSDHSGEWDGSLNDPMVGEKGMLSEAGIRVPFIVSWPGTLPAGVVSDTPVTTLDVATTSLAAAGVELPDELDGVNLIPSLSGDTVLGERPLYWRFWNQAAIRKGSWKFLKAGAGTEFLFNMDNTTPETSNVLSDYPDIADELRQQLSSWAVDLHRPGLSDSTLNNKEKDWYEHYFPAN
ncbi:hypothetical protein AB833_30580 [Chromatiales bacterium (ex Bugula neritina AB1)]|nr:hypothetical protein AB833_30580 [Chromatiales bacterium (ex Bugula neritina AB1)]